MKKEDNLNEKMWKGKEIIDLEIRIKEIEELEKEKKLLEEEIKKRKRKK